MRHAEHRGEVTPTVRPEMTTGGVAATAALTLLGGWAIWRLTPNNAHYAIHWAWLPGTAIGTLGGLYGGLCGWLAPRGVGRGPMLAAGYLQVAASAAMLVGGVALLVSGTSFFTWYSWLMPGAAGVVFWPKGLSMIRQVYDQTEMRRLESRDIAET